MPFTKKIRCWHNICDEDSKMWYKRGQYQAYIGEKLSSRVAPLELLCVRWSKSLEQVAPTVAPKYNFCSPHPFFCSPQPFFCSLHHLFSSPQPFFCSLHHLFSSPHRDTRQKDIHNPRSCHVPGHVMSCPRSCHVMSCHVMSCPRSCHVMSCHVTCHVMSCPRSCHVMSCPRSCHVMSPVMSCHVPGHVMSCSRSCHVMSPVMSCHVPGHVMSCPRSCHVMSPLMSCHVPSHVPGHVMSCPRSCHVMSHVMSCPMSCHVPCHVPGHVMSCPRSCHVICHVPCPRSCHVPGQDYHMSYRQDINLSFWRGRKHTHGIIQHPPVTWLQVCNKDQAYNQGDSTGQWLLFISEKVSIQVHKVLWALNLSELYTSGVRKLTIAYIVITCYFEDYYKQYTQ